MASRKSSTAKNGDRRSKTVAKQRQQRQEARQDRKKQRDAVKSRPPKKAAASKRPAFNREDATARTIRHGSRPCGTTDCCSARTSRSPAARTTRRRARGRSARRRCRSSRRWPTAGPSVRAPTTSASAFRAALGETRVRATIAHDSYLINLASPDATLRRRSIESFVAELKRCEALGLDVSRLASRATTSTIARAASSATPTRSPKRWRASPVARSSVMETTAGAARRSARRSRISRRSSSAIPEPLRARLGVCVDTCHAYSAGYDLVKAYDDVWDRFDDAARPGAAAGHAPQRFEDAVRFAPRPTRADRRRLARRVALSAHVMNDERLARMPKVIETPKGDDPTATDARMLALLRSYADTP